MCDTNSMSKLVENSLAYANSEHTRIQSDDVDRIKTENKNLNDYIKVLESVSRFPDWIGLYLYLLFIETFQF
jgi:hypothetical protein